MITSDYYKKLYLEIKDTKHITEYSVMEIIGYYVTDYPSDPLSRMMFDIENNDVPYVLASRALPLIKILSE